MKLHHKLMIVYIITFVIPVATLSYIYFQETQQLVVENVSDSYQKVLNQMNMSIDLNLRFYESIADNLMLSPIVQEAFDNPNEYIKKGIFMMNREITDSIRYINAYHSSVIENIQFFSLYSDQLSDGQYWFPAYSLRKMVNERYLQETNVWLYESNQDSNNHFYTLIRPVYSIKTFRKVGYLRLTVRISAIVPSNTNHNAGETMEDVFILNKDGVYLFHSQSGKIGESASPEIIRFFEEGAGTGQLVMLDRKPHFIWYEEIPLTSWRSVLVVPQSALEGSVMRFRNLLLLLSGMSMLLFTVISFLFIQRLTLGLRRLHHRVLHAGKGLHNEPRTDEVVELGRSFDDMLIQLEMLIRENYVEKLKKRELELDFLQAQINPHFLYNTLDAIKNEIDLGENDSAVRMVIALSDLFRISISKGKHLILWRDEFNHARCYLDIHHIRFGKHFEVEWEIDPEIYSLYTLKIVLQPVLENAIQHGLKHKRRGGFIRISAKRSEQGIVLAIRDNGEGMEQEKLAEIRKTLQNGGHSEGIGMQNINHRIKVHFGDEYGMVVNSAMGEGTEVKLLLPILKGDHYVPSITGGRRDVHKKMAYEQN